MDSTFDYDTYIKKCVFAWTAVALIWKNMFFVVLLILLRIKNKQINFPEDEKIFKRKPQIAHQPIPADTQQATSLITKVEWSVASRIAKVLANETEYVTYFLILFLAFTLVLEATTTRQIIYGGIFLISRCVHNSGVIFRISYARIIGFLFSVLVLLAITLDLAVVLAIEVAKQH